LKDISGDVIVRGIGSGVAMVSLKVDYNMQEPGGDDAFNLVVVVSDIDQNRISLAACGSYLGEGSSGMSVMQVGLPSGFFAKEDDLLNMVGVTPGLKRFDADGSKVVFYFDEILNKTQTCVTVGMSRSEALLTVNQLL
ncbi:CD109 antigen-like, partial [Saccoglossus kowalevskii]|uniref:CD109 antigen-like n=1 Tax=Saccoglossus kowalevskii TaxID=10224 RepID=A0ABM0MLK7_SACKO